MCDPSHPSIFNGRGRIGRVLAVLWSDTLPPGSPTACAIPLGFGVVGGLLLGLDLLTETGSA